MERYILSENAYVSHINKGEIQIHSFRDDSYVSFDRLHSFIIESMNGLNDVNNLKLELRKHFDISDIEAGKMVDETLDFLLKEELCEEFDYESILF